MKQLLLSCLLLLPLLANANPSANGVLDIAHRGYAAMNPESTLQAFQYAIDSGADGLELDIRQSADNVLLVTHEPVIAEIGSQRVENTQSKQAFLKSNIPSLEEVIILAKQYRIPLWIEIKQSHLYPGITQRLIALLNQYDYLNNVVIQSFNHQDLLAVYQMNPNIPLLALFTNNFDMSRLPTFVELVGLPITPRYADPALIAALHSVGKGVIFWRQNAASERGDIIRRFIEIGADGFMLDRPLDEVLSSP
ncbi:glycerophosphodiester phosphodiesterase [Leucothrix pacifica]|uniref:GP-PDE domain-containing protein n=1 Tax=Leucothrix pacifica TaxID=1247513 RepID=A0A317C3C2_9GAMM|nr:glycerophosphodiester phosphodiesterase [Leucothrix pacifica]PWQ92797.1 hypothetical protein DKW60_19505 [Leucothrix pacifica]